MIKNSDNINENNKLIAKFMGWKVRRKPYDYLLYKDWREEVIYGEGGGLSYVEK